MPYYVSYATNSSTAGTVCCDYPYNTTAASSTSTNWASWTIPSNCVTISGGAVQPPPLTPEQIKANRMEEGRLEKERKKAEEQKQLAETVARQLMEIVLGHERLQEYIKQGKVSLDSPSKPGRQYSIDARNTIEVRENGKLVDRLCIHLVDAEQYRHDSQWLPDADVVVGKAMLVLSDEKRLLATANHNPVHPAP
jgi:hypothetical protein